METTAYGGGGRTVLAVAGGIVSFLAAGLVVAGIALLWLGSQRNPDGFFTTGPHRFQSPTFAISSAGLEVVADVPRWLFVEDRLGTIRIRSARSSKPIFVGVGPASAVRRFLADVPHEIATEVGTRPFGVTYNQAIGSRPPSSPGGAGFWAASGVVRDSGAVSWNVKRGSWTVVVMNADGSAGIDASLELGAKVPFLTPTGIAFTASGGVLLLAGLAAVVYGLRNRPPPRPLGPLPAGVPEHELETVGPPA